VSHPPAPVYYFSLPVVQGPRVLNRKVMAPTASFCNPPILWSDPRYVGVGSMRVAL
jgi:hypothetical protein